MFITKAVYFFSVTELTPLGSYPDFYTIIWRGLKGKGEAIPLQAWTGP
jgi:hypothetical protein